MKNVFLLMLAVTLLFASCEKDKPDCEANNTGEVMIHNSADESFSLFVNGSFVDILPSYSDYNLIKPAGLVYTLELKETNYIILPTEHKTDWISEQCIFDTWSPSK